MRIRSIAPPLMGADVDLPVEALPVRGSAARVLKWAGADA